MVTDTFLRRAGAPGRGYAPHRTLERQLDRFAFAVRPGVARLAAAHPYLADLAFTFPGLLAGLAQQARGTRPLSAAPDAALAAACSGMALRKVAALAGVPGWLRTLPPEAFADALRPLPDTPALRLGLANFRPRRQQAARWLRSVGLCLEWGDDGLALWIAREAAAREAAIRAGTVPAIIVHHWASRQAAAPWRDLLRKPWCASMTLRTAREEARALIAAVDVHVLAEQRLSKSWCQAGEVEGFRFTPVTTVAALTAESDTMRNCLRTYAVPIAVGRSQIVAVQHDGQHIATMEIGFEDGRPLIEILQLKGPGNAAIDRTVWRSARRWLDANDVLAIEPALDGQFGSDRVGRRWRALWLPFWLEKRRIPSWLPLRPLRWRSWAI